MSTKHTQGPWRLTLHGNVVSTHGPMVASVVLSEEETPSKSANGLLIAAAPDLLAALKNMLAAYGGGAKLCGHSFECVCVGNLARAAVAKAEGL